jgi:sigma-B regulation protein RsbU (phosphoserine phosphatase)
LIYGILNPRRREFRYVRAGHPFPIHVPAKGAPRQLSAGGMPIGISPSAQYKTELLELAPGDRLYLFSDGLPESENDDGEFFDVKRVLEAIDSDAPQELDAALQSVIRDALRWRNHRSPEDDLTLLGIEMA